MYPNTEKNRQIRDLKLGIKSSIPNPLKLLSLVYLIWISNDKKTDIEYSREVIEQKNTMIKFEEEVYKKLEEYLKNSGIKVDDQFREEIEKNGLFKHQYEALLVALELVWKILKIEFVKPLSGSIERTGGNRYSKKISFTRNIDIFHSLIRDIPNITKILYEFIFIPTKTKIDSSNIHEMKLAYALTFIMEDSKYLLKDISGKDKIFSTEGIYEILEANRQSIVEVNSSVEAKGALRILHSLLGDNLNCYLEIETKFKEVKLRKSKFEDDKEIIPFGDYFKRLENYKDLSNSVDIKYNITENVAYSIEEGNTIILQEKLGEIDYNLRLEDKYSYQRIIYGAPGTGKSNLLKLETIDIKKNIERVTFYDGYTYGQFIGAYKPVPIKSDCDLQNEDINYKYVAGPLFRQLIKAFKNSESDFILIIEEINRARADRVFGNIFQLLDRDGSGKSEYPVSLTEEQEKFLKENLGEKIFTETIGMNNGLYLPSNLYIWATMNSADQGVYPMDSAFKRRWNFQYIGLDENADKFGKKDLKYFIQLYKIEEKNENGTQVYQEVEWNKFRKTINNALLNEKIPEDRLLAPFFVKPEDFDTENESDKQAFWINNNIYESKILMYLFDDVLRHLGKSKIFDSKLRSFSELVTTYKLGKNIFNEKLTSEMLKKETSINKE
ncbi:MAG: AAA family ATPase [Fusobacteriaceae bacterium]